MSAEEIASRLIYRHVAGLEQKITLLESQKAELEDRVNALVEALKTAREYVREHIASQQIHFCGFEFVSGIQASKGDLAKIDAALRAAGEGR